MYEYEKLISIAKEQVGYLEKKSNKDLDDKTANAGSNNYTKFARDLDNIKDFYNGKKNGYPWCDVFVDWLFVQAFGVEYAKELLCQPNKSLGAGVSYSAKYYKNKGQFYRDAKVGDQIFFKNYSHTGIVYKVDSRYVYTIEGNTSSAAGIVSNGGCVRMKKYAVGSSLIEGYGRPNYKYIAPPKQKYSGEFPSLPKRKYFKKTDTGNEVKKVQKFLNWSVNAKLSVDGIYGPKTFNAVKKFQKAAKISVDGLFGQVSLKAAKNYEK